MDVAAGECFHDRARVPRIAAESNEGGREVALSRKVRAFAAIQEAWKYFVHNADEVCN